MAIVIANYETEMPVLYGIGKVRESKICKSYSDAFKHIESVNGNNLGILALPSGKISEKRYMFYVHAIYDIVSPMDDASESRVYAWMVNQAERLGIYEELASDGIL